MGSHRQPSSSSSSCPAITKWTVSIGVNRVKGSIPGVGEAGASNKARDCETLIIHTCKWFFSNNHEMRLLISAAKALGSEPKINMSRGLRRSQWARDNISSANKWSQSGLLPQLYAMFIIEQVTLGMTPALAVSDIATLSCKRDPTAVFLSDTHQTIEYASALFPRCLS